MTPEDIITRIFAITPVTVVHLFLILLLVFHTVFSIVLVRQAQRMIRVVEANISPIIVILALLHLAASLLITFIAVITL